MQVVYEKKFVFPPISCFTSEMMQDTATVTTECQ